MKTTFILFCTLFLNLFFLSAQPIEKNDGPKITFEKTTIDYGRVTKNAEPLRKFYFTNTGNKALVITGAHGSCGCTVPDYPKEAIAPGEKSAIDVRYDTNRLGIINKTITVTTNDNSTTILTITGEVLDSK